MASKSWSQVDNEDGAQEGVEQAQIEERKRNCERKRGDSHCIEAKERKT